MTRTDNARVSRRLRGFGPVGLIAAALILAGNLIIAPLSALLVLAWRQASETPWRDIGFRSPGNLPIAVLQGLVLGVALKLLLKAVVMPLLGAPQVNEVYRFLAGNPAALPPLLYSALISAAVGEEILFRGYLFERMGALFGASTVARAAILMLTSALFGAAHFADQGLPGAQQAVIAGLAFGLSYIATGSLILPIIAHAAFNLTAIVLIYLDLETAVAGAIFR